MTAIIGFVLECAAIAALLGVAVALPGLLIVALSRSLATRISPGLRADLTFVAGVLPAIIAVAGTAAAAMPSVAAGLGLAADHCREHGHHLHVCFIHSTGIRPDVAVVGAFALIVWVVRASSLVWNGLVFMRDVRRLEDLGAIRAGDQRVIEVPSSIPLCHAVGALRRRILLSTSLATRIDALALRCALAHEHAHLRRRDPLASLALSLAGLFVPPPVAKLSSHAYRAAAEEACDDDAAYAVGDRTLVAGALVAVARAQQETSWRPAAAQVFGFGQHRIETRVRRLLAGATSKVRPAYALPVATAAGLGVFAVALQHAAFLHHAVETALHQLF